MIGEDEAVIGDIGLAELAEALGVLFPREAAAIDDRAAQCRAVPAS